MHRKFRDLVPSIYDEYRESLVRVPELERKLSKTESNLKSAILEAERMKSELSSETKKLREAEAAMGRELEVKLEQLLAEKERIMEEVAESFRTQVMEQAQKAYEKGFRDAVVKYNIPFEEEEEEEDGEEEERVETE